VLRDAWVGDGCVIGPLPRCALARNWSDCRVGNFVEIKTRAPWGGCKVNHLSLHPVIPSSERGQCLGRTITAKLRTGVRKHRTVIGAGSKTGGHSVLVGPIKRGSNCDVGAGSTLTRDAPDGAPWRVSRTPSGIKPTGPVCG